MLSLYLPHHHDNYDYTQHGHNPVDYSHENYHKMDKFRGHIDRRETETDEAKHSHYIESKLKEHGITSNRIDRSKIKTNNNVEIHSYKKGSYLIGKDKNILHDLYNMIQEYSDKNKTHHKNAVNKSTKWDKEANLIFEEVELYEQVYKTCCDGIHKYFKVKAANKQLAEEAANVYKQYLVDKTK